MKSLILILALVCGVSIAWAQPETQPDEPAETTQPARRQKRAKRHQPVVKIVQVKVPAQAELETATGKMRELHREEFSKQNTVDLLALADKLMSEATGLTGEKALQYVMLTEAIDLAARSSDTVLSMSAADALVARFEVDEWLVRGKALVTSGRNAKTKDQAGMFLGEAEVVLEAQAAKGEFDEVMPLMKLMQGVGRAMPDAVGASELVERVDVLMKQAVEYSKVRGLALKLATEPSNPQANAAVGKYHAMSREDWAVAIPMLKQGDDATFRAAAELDDSGAAATPQAQVKVGDAWMGVALKQQLSQRAAIYKRALHWFRIAEPKLENMEHLALQRKIEDARQGIVGPGKPTFVLDLERDEVEAVQKFRDHYYLVVERRMTYEHAREWAKKHGGHLTSIADRAENEFVVGMAKLTLKEHIWIGGSDEVREGVWAWEDGSPWRFTNWDTNEPNNAKRHENRASIAGSGRWNDVPPFWKLRFVVRW